MKTHGKTGGKPRRHQAPEEPSGESTFGSGSGQRVEEPNVVRLAPDVALAFPDEASVNTALRLVIQLAGIPKPN